MTSATRWIPRILLTTTILAGCNSGLKAYDEYLPYLEDLDYDEDDDYQTVSDEDCATVCLAALDTMEDLMVGEDACTYECGVEIGTSFDGSVDTSVLYPLLQVEVDGELQVGGACEMILDCSTGCQGMAQDCIAANPGNDELVAECMEEYRECKIDEACIASQLSCGETADELLYDCVNGGTPLGECQDIWLEAHAVCNCVYIECVDSGDPTECIDAQPAMQPYSPSPGRWAIPGSFFEEATSRIGGIGREVFLIPRVGQNGLMGIELGSISEGDTLSRLGLQDGDVFRGVDGISAAEVLESPGLAMAALADGEFDVLIHRGTQSRVVEYRVLD